MRKALVLLLLGLSCQPLSAPPPVTDRPAAGSESSSAPSGAHAVPPTRPSAAASASSDGPAGPAPSLPAAPVPAGPASLDVEYQIYDHRVSFAPSTPHGLILNHLSVDLVVQTVPKQTLTIGSFQNQNCMLSPSAPAPFVSGLACSFDGLVGSVELVRVQGDRVRVDAVEGPDGQDARGRTRAWAAGTVSIPEGVLVSPSTVDRDERLRLDSNLAPLAITLHREARGARLDVATTPAQSVVIPRWDPTGCVLHSKLDMARIAFVECLAPQRGALLAYVAHDIAEIWLFDGSSHFPQGKLDVVGRVRIPRDRPLVVSMTSTASLGP